LVLRLATGGVDTRERFGEIVVGAVKIGLIPPLMFAAFM
jgi:hypothetical protein